jgi:hypothetical protein
MKTVNYRGGLVSFEIPSHWTEDSDLAGSARFFEDAVDSGTMRLNLLTFERKDSRTLDQAASEVFHNEPYELLAGQLPMRHSLTAEDEEGELLHVHRWDVLVAVSPQLWGLVCFGYTGLASSAGEAHMQQEIRAVDHAVRTARYVTAPQT